jgi:hypothetical protein
LLGLGFASHEAYPYVAAVSAAGVEALNTWRIIFIRYVQEHKRLRVVSASRNERRSQR